MYNINIRIYTRFQNPTSRFGENSILTSVVTPILDFMKQQNEMMGWQQRQLNHMHIICTSLQTDNHASTSSLNFYTPNALPDAQPTVSKH